VTKLILPKHLTDTEAVELIYGPPHQVLRERDMRKYQLWMSDKMCELRGSLIGAEMGLGKTGSSIHAMVRMLRDGTILRPLVVAPLYVAEWTWPDEFRTWEFSRDVSFRVVTGTAEERLAALKYPAEVTIINRENLRWLHELYDARPWPFDSIWYDEVSRLKQGLIRVRQSKEQRKKGVKAGFTELGVIQARRAQTKRFVGLSGTPAPNGLIDLWGPIFACDAGQRLGTSITAYKQRWFKEDKYDYSITPFAHSEEQIMGRIEDIFFSLRAEDYITLPKLITVNHAIKLPDKARKIYRQMEAEMGVEMVNRAGDPVFIEAVNNGVLVNKLLQLANGSIYDENGEDIPVHSAKLDVLESIMEEAAGKPVLVGYSFQFDKAAIKKKFPYVRILGESKDDIRDWNDGKIRMLLTHPASAGHGLNIQRGSNIAVWYGLTWSLELYLQFLKRLHRPGQQADRVFLHHIIAEDTADENVLAVCGRKGATQDQITDCVRVRLAA
jgi:SNF2 family DNA or RNA helicase